MSLLGWTKKAEVTLKHANITRLGEYPFLFHKNNLPTGIVTLGGSDACKADGGDIRCSTDQDGNFLIPCSVMRIVLGTPADSVLLLYVRLDITSLSTDKTFWIHWGNAGAETPASSSLYGSANCFSELYGVNFFQENPADFTGANGWKFAKDVTGNFSGFTNVSGSVQESGAVDSMMAISLGAGERIVSPEVVSMAQGFGVYCWVYVDSLAGKQMLLVEDGGGNNDFKGVGWNNGVPIVEWTSDWNNTILTANAWNLVGFWRDGANMVAYANGNMATWASSVSFNISRMGDNDTATFEGRACMFFCTRTQPLDVAWLEQMQLNYAEVGNSTFATSGAVQTSVVGVSLTIIGLEVGSDVVILESGTNTVLDAVDQTVGTTFIFSSPTPVTIDIGIVKQGFVTQYIYGYSLASSSTYPVNQIVDRNYL